jgi:hypothetical protein
LRFVADSITAGVTPVPVRATFCGLPAALSVILTLADRVPAAVGLNVTLMEQFAPAATLPPHVLVCAKSPAFAPAIEMLAIVSVAVPVLDRFTICTPLVVPTFWLPKLMLFPPNVTLGATPVPLSATLCGLPANLCVTVMAPLRTPVAVGMNATFTVQFAATPSVAGLTGHVLVCVKSPLAAIVIVVAAAPLFVIVIACVALLVPTSWFANVKLLGKTFIGGGV